MPIKFLYYYYYFLLASKKRLCFSTVIDGWGPLGPSSIHFKPVLIMTDVYCALHSPTALPSASSSLVFISSTLCPLPLCCRRHSTLTSGAKGSSCCLKPQLRRTSLLSSAVTALTGANTRKITVEHGQGLKTFKKIKKNVKMIVRPRCSYVSPSVRSIPDWLRGRPRLVCTRPVSSVFTVCRMIIVLKSTPSTSRDTIK